MKGFFSAAKKLIEFVLSPKLSNDFTPENSTHFKKIIINKYFVFQEIDFRFERLLMSCFMSYDSYCNVRWAHKNLSLEMKTNFHSLCKKVWMTFYIINETDELIPRIFICWIFNTIIFEILE